MQLIVFVSYVMHVNMHYDKEEHQSYILFRNKIKYTVDDMFQLQVLP